MDNTVIEILNTPSGKVINLWNFIMVLLVGGILFLLCFVDIPVVHQFSFQIIERDTAQKINIYFDEVLILRKSDALKLSQGSLLQLNFQNLMDTTTHHVEVASITTKDDEMYATVYIKLKKPLRISTRGVLFGTGIYKSEKVSIFNYLTNRLRI